MIAFYVNKMENSGFIFSEYINVKWMGFISQKVFYLDFKTIIMWKIKSAFEEY